MHDLTFAKEILIVLNDKLKSLPRGSKIKVVNASLSLLSHVKPETLKETFAAMVKGTELEKITLKIGTLQLGIKCRACKNGFMVNKPVTECPECSSSDLDVIYFKEFTIDSIEVHKK